jgi:hypothetical protein
LAVFVAFLAIVAIRVGRADLFIVIALCLGLAVYDLWAQLARRRR